MSTPSGPAWCTRFPTSRSLEDLDASWRPSVKRFFRALSAAGASINVAATLRPWQRAWLMHYACLVAGYRGPHNAFIQLDPMSVPARAELDIDWTHGGDRGAAISAAVAMRNAFAIVFPPALDSLHTKGLAVDIDIQWAGPLSIARADGSISAINSQPANGLNPELWLVGKTYGVVKLPSDAPHWSATGH